MNDEFKRGDVIILIDTDWRILITGERHEVYFGVPFRPNEKITPFDVAHRYFKGDLHRCYVKVCEMKVPGWL